jgi:hypothetical protein
METLALLASGSLNNQAHVKPLSVLITHFFYPIALARIQSNQAKTN